MAILAISILVFSVSVESIGLVQKLELIKGGQALSESRIWRTREIGDPHTLFIGGRILFVWVRFKWDEKSISWTALADEQPIAFQIQDNNSILVTRLQDQYGFSFCYYKAAAASGKWERVERRDVPLEMAVQNIGLLPEDSALLHAFDPKSYWVRDSYTAAMWWDILNGAPPSGEVPESFLNEVLENRFHGRQDLFSAKNK